MGMHAGESMSDTCMQGDEIARKGAYSSMMHQSRVWYVDPTSARNSWQPET